MTLAPAVVVRNIRSVVVHRKFSPINLLKGIGALLILGIPYLIGFLPFNTWFGLEEPIGGLLRWTLGLLYCLAVVVGIFGICFVGVSIYLIVDFLFPKIRKEK